jgi:hypothetical protein
MAGGAEGADRGIAAGAEREGPAGAIARGDASRDIGARPISSRIIRSRGAA